jgi:multiple sugar transport system permease protein
MSVSVTANSRRDAAARRAVGRRIVKKFWVYVGLTAGALFAGLPVLWMLSSSFKSNSAIFEYPPKLIDSTFSLSAYRAVLSSSQSLRFFLNSYVIALSVTALTLIVALHTAYAFSRYRFRLKGVLNVIIIGSQAVPPVALLIPYFGLMVSLHLYNSYQGLILTYIILTLPYAIIMMTAYIDGLPRELDEAAKMDGARPLTTLWRVLVPICGPGLVSTGLYTFMISWNEYLFALTLTQTNNMRTVPVGIQLLMGENNFQWNQVMAISILGCIPVLVLFLIFQRHFIQGLASGAVKS